MFNTILEEIDAVFARDPAARSRLEIIFCYPGFHAMLGYRLSHFLWSRGFRFLGRWVSSFSRFLSGVEIHPGATIGKRFFIDHGMGVVIGETATIGDDVTIYHDVTLGGTSFEKGIRHPQVGNGVIIGAGAQLLGPIRVGDQARIGSNAVVVKDVPEGASMVGVPARVAVPKITPLHADPCHFDSYGTPQGEVQDPLMKALEAMQQEMSALKGRMQELEAQNNELDKTAKRWEG